MSYAPPVVKTCEPTAATEVAAAVQDAGRENLPIYPSGGGTSLNYGLAVSEAGVKLSLAKMSQVIDYPARDMTVTVEAGVTIETLNNLLASEGQQLPFDVPQQSQATVGGIVATNFNGPRRYGYGAIRDYVIGIEAVDGSGRIFHGGGRVVKNVAGYDFCKLLTGSLGTLGIMTQFTFKLRPLAEARQLVVATLPTGTDAQERVFAQLATSAANPVAIELLAGKGWDVGGDASEKSAQQVVVRLEGATQEVAWMTTQLQRELNEVGCVETQAMGDAAGQETLWQSIVAFPADAAAAVVLQAQLVPSGVVPFVTQLRASAPDVVILAHAGQGTIFAKFAAPPPGGFSKLITNDLQPLASLHGGKVFVLSHNSALELTAQVCWGGAPAGLAVMQLVKKQFDPRNILNRARYVFAAK